MDRTSVIAVIICSIVIFYAWTGMEKDRADEQKKTTTEEVSDKPDSKPKKDVAKATKVEKKVVAVESLEVKKSPSVKADSVTLSSDFFSVTIDPEKGGITKTTLTEKDSNDQLRFVNNKKDKNPVEIGSADYPGLSFDLLNSDSKLELVAAPIATESSLTTTSHLSEDPTTHIIQKWELVKGKEDSKYKIDYTLTVQNQGDKEVTLKDTAIACGVSEPLLPHSTGRKYDGATTQTVGLYNEKTKDLKTHKLSEIKEMKKSELEVEDNLKWISTENRYFCSILTPESKFTGIKLSAHDMPSQGLDENGKKDEDKIARYVNAKGLLPEINVAVGQSQSFKIQAYIGPKEYENLKALGHSNEDLLNLGWGFIGSIGKLVMYALNYFHNKLGLSYALAIIMITVLIKSLFWPITHKSTVSMKKMAKLQPLVKEIKEKYKDDSQLVQKKTMELYREKKVSPLGGCLPMLIQIPVFFALYSTFGSAIELRHQTFLWVGDLGMPDTVISNLFGLVDINPLAIIMVIAMLLQQHFTPSSGDPNQKKMMMFMPVVMLFFMYSMPAGLTLYWTVNQLMSMLQFYFTNKSVAKAEKVEAVAN